MNEIHKSKITIFKRRYFRDNWPLVFAISSLLLTFFVIVVSFSDSGAELLESDTEGTYWWLIFLHRKLYDNSVLIAAFILVTILSLISIISPPRTRNIVFSIILTCNVISLMLCGCNLFSVNPYLKHVASVQFEDRIYYLAEAISHAGNDIDNAVSGFMVYQCDVAGIYCTAIAKNLAHWAATARQGRFYIDPDENVLYVSIDGEKPIYITK